MKDVLKGRDPVSQLYRAINRYVRANGGSVLVIGGVQLQRMPGDLEMNFTIGVRCTGKAPVFTDKKGT